MPLGGAWIWRFLSAALVHVLSTVGFPERRSTFSGKRRPTFKPFAGLQFLNLRGPSWPRADARARRLRDRLEHTDVDSLGRFPAWERHSEAGEQKLPDGSHIGYAATAQPHRHWTEIVSVDLNLGVDDVLCSSLGGRHVSVVIEGLPEVVAGIAESVRMAATLGGEVLLIGSSGWTCDGDRHWYISTRHVSAESKGDVYLVGRLLALDDVFEVLDISLSLSPPPQERRLNDVDQSDGASYVSDSGTSFGFNWDFEADRVEAEMLNLLAVDEVHDPVESDIVSGLSAECVQCFARAVIRLDISYQYASLQQPRIYISAEGSAELHGWLEFLASGKLPSQTWERTLASHILPTIHFSILTFPLSFTPFATFRSKLIVQSDDGVFSGSLRSGFGGRGHVVGRLELNTRGWKEGPHAMPGVQGLRTSLDIVSAQRFATPSFLIASDNASVVLQLVPTIGIRFWGTYSAELSAESYLGIQVVDKDTAFDFAQSSGRSIYGRLFARPDFLRNVGSKFASDAGTFQVFLSAFGEERSFNPKAPCSMAQVKIPERESESLHTCDFKSSDLPPEQYVNFTTNVKSSILRSLDIQARVLHNRSSGQDEASEWFSRGTVREREESNHCRDVPMLSGIMFLCNFEFRLLSKSREHMGTLTLSVYWVPMDLRFAPLGERDLHFTHPSPFWDEGKYTIWGAGEQYEIVWLIDTSSVTTKQVKDVHGKFVTELESPVQLQAVLNDNTEVKMQPTFTLTSLLGACGRTFVYIPKDVDGPMNISARWTELSNGVARYREKSVMVWLTPLPNFYVRFTSEYLVNPPSPKASITLTAFQDLHIRWGLRNGAEGVVNLYLRRLLRFTSTLELLHATTGLNAASGQSVIHWLHFRGHSRSGHDFFLAVEFCDRYHPTNCISIVRKVAVQALKTEAQTSQIFHTRSDEVETGSRRLVHSIDRANWYTGLDGGVRKKLFEGCKASRNYTMFGGIDSLGKFGRVGPCQSGASCPAVGGGKGGWEASDGLQLGQYSFMQPLETYSQVVLPAELRCENAGWCRGQLYTCGGVASSDQHVVELELARAMEPPPNKEQLEFILRRFSLSLSLLPQAISILDFERIASDNPVLAFRIEGKLPFKLSHELVQACVDSGLLSFKNTHLLVPIESYSNGSAVGPSDSAFFKRRLFGDDSHDSPVRGAGLQLRITAVTVYKVKWWHVTHGFAFAYQAFCNLTLLCFWSLVFCLGSRRCRQICPCGRKVARKAAEALEGINKDTASLRERESELEEQAARSLSLGNLSFDYGETARFGDGERESGARHSQCLSPLPAPSKKFSIGNFRASRVSVAPVNWGVSLE